MIFRGNNTWLCYNIDGWGFAGNLLRMSLEMKRPWRSMKEQGSVERGLSFLKRSVNSGFLGHGLLGMRSPSLDDTPNRLSAPQNRPKSRR